ncbi:ABC transporter ATP-binding protein [Arenibaculum sp.]|jgi:glycerol transport system ATP-binding protein|uniref:ABC transporter ATP-binding protein n=1 Tax=Arenibaculum sp. TaxID=2865862 RepID=UPI002E15F6A7|nr:ABC transporter ATP-binding protein [Arenibaculum sp.]
MATIDLVNLAHSYEAEPKGPQDYAVRQFTQSWRDGAAYALLGPSGCGKTTLLNIISGLVTPSEGRILFDGRDVTGLSPEARNIAQVFQFPVIYDTMTVYENLAFPLRNRKVPAAEVDARVRKVAGLLDLGGELNRRAHRLTADAKQKISMGRGLVRSDVAAILFDEPLTVIDPHMKWQLRRKLREVHEEFRLSLIYVTHDQVEALTFADEVAVMHEGQIVQLGTPQELFERPAHTFVGYFIGSPGMNLMPCELGPDHAVVDGVAIPLDPGRTGRAAGDGRFELGIRPEFVEVAPAGGPGAVPVAVSGVEHLGTHRLVTARLGRHPIKVRLADDRPIPADGLALRFPPERTLLYRDSRLAS